MNSCKSQASSHKLIRLFAMLAVLAVLGCASAPVDQIDLMPAPDVYGDGLLDPLPEEMPMNQIPYNGILYATDRKPAGSEDPEKYYINDRGTVLRVGVGRVILGTKEIDWKTARTISLLKARTEKYPIKVNEVQEWGVLKSTIPFYADLENTAGAPVPPDATAKFAQQINAQLARSKRKDVYIYLHGYKVVYENPLLVGAELWHFLGYDGVFIAYAWPSTPSKFAYLKDSDTSAGFARNFRLLLEFLSEETDVEEIHVVGYSNGTRLVTRALEQLALIHQDETREEIQRKRRIGNVILVGSDVDRGVFGAYLSDGMLNVPRHTSVYMSKFDKALGVSQYLTRRERLGQMFDDDNMSPSGRKLLEEYSDQVSAINVSDAEGAGTGNGHGYFRNSPWASSDVLMTLAYSLTPKQRGLVRQDDAPVYMFPPDYVQRLWSSLAEVDPKFADAYEAFRAKQQAP